MLHSAPAQFFRARGPGSFAGWDSEGEAIAKPRAKGKIVRHGRQVFLKISAAMLDMFAAIRERCARIMREGGAVLETT
jgi:hypothetical protein